MQLYYFVSSRKQKVGADSTEEEYSGIQTNTYGWHKEIQDSGEMHIDEHMLHMKHTIEFDKTKVIAKISIYYSEVVRESIELR